MSTWTSIADALHAIPNLRGAACVGHAMTPAAPTPPTNNDLDESRSAAKSLDEAERASNCGHSCRGRNGMCVDCGDGPDS